MKYIRGFIFTFVFYGLSFLLSGPVLAAQLQTAQIRYDRIKINSPSNVLVKFVPSSVATENKVKVNLAAGVVVFGVSYSNTDLGAGVVQLPGSPSISSSGQDVVVSGLTDLSVGTTYGFNISVGISTPSSTGEYLDTITTLTSLDAVIDSARVASRFIVDDQIIITANVPPIFNFTISGNTDAFTGDLTPSSVVSTNGQTVTVVTNASKGWTGWIKSQNLSLLSSLTGETIPTLGTVDGSTDTCTNGADCYLIDAQKTTTGTGTGALNIDAEYAGNGTTTGGTLSGVYQPFASRTGKTAGDVITLKAHASVISTKTAGSDYSDVLTIIGAGNF